MGAGIGGLQAPETVKQPTPLVGRQPVPGLDRRLAGARGRAQQVRLRVFLAEKIALGQLVQHGQHDVGRLALTVQVTHAGDLETVAAEGLQFDAQLPEDVEMGFEQGHL